MTSSTIPKAKEPDAVDEKFAKKYRGKKGPNASYKCLTLAGHHVVVEGNVGQSVDEIMQIAADKHNLPIVDVVEEKRYPGAKETDE